MYFFFPLTLAQWEMVKQYISNDPNGHNKTSRDKSFHQKYNFA